MTTLTVVHLKELHKQLTHYVDPRNKKGFYRKFCFWVVQQWNSRDYYESEIRDSGYDYSTIPKRTNIKLKDEAKSYNEFINANTGQAECTHVSGYGMRCETMEERLSECYGDACSEFISKFLELHAFKLPDSVNKEYADNVWDAMFGEAFDYKETPDLYAANDAIILGFNLYGSEQEPYTCPMYDVDSYDDNYFGKWTLADFKKELIVK